MRTENRGIHIVPLLTIIVLVIGSVAIAGQDTLVTVTGSELSGTVSGIDTVVRLNVVPAAGPISVFDIPRDKISQITIDFPRVIVETADRVYIGPFSDFTGIGQVVDVHHDSVDTSIPLAGVRAIVLNDSSIHPVPRQWLGDRFLTKPTITIASVQAIPATGTSAAASTSEHPINWAKINPSRSLPPEESTGTPWWVAILIVAGLAGLIYFSLVTAKG